MTTAQPTPRPMFVSPTCTKCFKAPATGVLGLCAACILEAQGVAEHALPEHILETGRELSLEQRQRSGVVAPGKARGIGNWDKCVECGAELALQHQGIGLCPACSYPRQLEEDRGPAALVRKRAALWAERSSKWHRRLDRERSWVSLGLAAPILAPVLASAAGAHGMAAITAALLATVFAGIFSWRGSLAKSRLEGQKIEQAWVCADRLDEHYRGLVAMLERMDADNHAPTFESGVFTESQRLEAAARFGLPESLRSVLDEVTK